MRGRRILVLVAAGCVVTWWVAQEPSSRPQHTSSTATTSPPTGPSSRPVVAADSTATSRPPVGEELGESEEGRQEVESYRRDLADPAHSDLPPPLFARLTELGTRVQLAYLTGVGREEFPGYFGRDAVPALYTDVHIESAGARSRNGRRDAADVTVAWSGRPTDGGPPVDHHTTVVLLVSRDGDWQPQAQFG
jgi:hypothetical protein